MAYEWGLAELCVCAVAERLACTLCMQKIGGSSPGHVKSLKIFWGVILCYQKEKNLKKKRFADLNCSKSKLLSLYLFRLVFFYLINQLQQNVHSCPLGG